MESYFLNEKGNFKENLLNIEAKGEAEKLRSAKPKLNETQIRKFFNEVKFFEKRLKDNNNSDECFEKIFPLIKMLKAKVAYAFGRRVVPKEFVDFLNKNINEIKSKKDFQAFALHFEAIVGYYYEKGF